MEFKDRLKKARLKAGLTQLELDKLCKKKGCSTSHYECGRRSPDIATIRSLMKHLKINANYLFKR